MTAASIALNSGPIIDVDVWWHIRVGDYTLHGHAFPYPDPFAYTVPGHHWHSTSWLAELTLAAVNDAAGMAGIVGLRLLFQVLITWALFRQLVRSSQGWSGPLVLVVALLPLTSYMQERPQTVSLLFLVWLASRARVVLDEGLEPRRWQFVAMTYLWATIHGLFVLAPFTLVLLAVGRLLDHGPRDSLARRLTVTAITATTASAFTPMGPRLLLSPFTVSRAARTTVAEWAPTNVDIAGTLGFFAVLAILLAVGVRSTNRLTRSQTLYVLVFATFGLLAIRNAGAASLMLAPLVVRVLDNAMRTTSDLTLPALPLRLLSGLAIAAACLSWIGKPVFPPHPTRIARFLAAQAAPHRVLAQYDLSGYLIYEDGAKVQLVVDGRTDRYGAGFLQSFQKATRGDSSWRSFVTRADPDFAVLPSEGPLSQLLLDAGWQDMMKDHGELLLKAPS